MRVIGLTGGIACGKSTVSSWLSHQPGCRIIDGDLLSRELTAPGGAALPLIRARFGDACFTPAGQLNRRRLGALVFSDDAARQALDDLMAPLLRRRTREEIGRAREEGVSLCFLDFPLLFEKGYEDLCDTVWCVYLPRELQLQRLMQRDQLSEEEALQRMDAVLSSEEKATRSQVVIDNSGEISFTLSLLPPLLEAEWQQAVSSTPRRRRSGAGRSDAASADRGHGASFGRSTSLDPAPDNHPLSFSGAEGPVPRAQPASSEPVPEPRSPSISGTEKPVSRARPTPEPPTLERPAAARRKKESRRSPWLLPSWLLTLLIIFGFAVLSCITSQLLMRAYLTRQQEKHLAEDRAIHAQFPLEYGDLIAQGAAENNLNPAFVAAIIRNESSFQPRAESGVGARGLMQLMPDTAEWIAGKKKVSGYAFERMYDPESNISFGCWYLRYLANLFHGDPVCVACAYHAGQGQVTAWLSDARYSPDGVNLPLDTLLEGPTKNYAGKVIRAYGIYQSLYYQDALSDAGPVDASAAVSPGE